MYSSSILERPAVVQEKKTFLGLEVKSRCCFKEYIFNHMQVLSCHPLNSERSALVCDSQILQKVPVL